MSDDLPLPPRPNLEQYKKLAKDFQHACRSGDPAAIHDWAARWTETLARLQGQEITPEVRQEIDWDTERVERQWRETQKSKERVARCTVADAQYFVARCHGFASWPKFVSQPRRSQLTNVTSTSSGGAIIPPALALPQAT